MRRPISSKSETCTEGMDVYAAGISVKVARITRGGLHVCLPLWRVNDYGNGDVAGRAWRSQPRA